MADVLVRPGIGQKTTHCSLVVTNFATSENWFVEAVRDSYGSTPVVSGRDIQARSIGAIDLGTTTQAFTPGTFNLIRYTLVLAVM
jgi:hypothetical protein